MEQKAEKVPFLRYKLTSEHAVKTHEDLAIVLKLTYKQGEAPGSPYVWFYCSKEESVCQSCGSQMIAVRENGSAILEVFPGVPNSVRARIEEIAKSE